MIIPETLAPRRFAVLDVMIGGWYRSHRVAGWHEILYRDPCCYCGLAPVASMDHIQPRARGGGSAWWNITGACRQCNTLKGSGSMLAFVAKMGRARMKKLARKEAQRLYLTNRQAIRARRQYGELPRAVDQGGTLMALRLAAIFPSRGA